MAPATQPARVVAADRAGADTLPKMEGTMMENTNDKTAVASIDTPEFRRLMDRYNTLPHHKQTAEGFTTPKADAADALIAHINAALEARAEEARREALVKFESTANMWRRRSEVMEAERDEARAQLAAQADDVAQVREALALCEPEDQQAFERVIGASEYALHPSDDALFSVAAAPTAQPPAAQADGECDGSGPCGKGFPAISCSACAAPTAQQPAAQPTPKEDAPILADRGARELALVGSQSVAQPTPEENAKAKWNTGADQYNQWSELGQDEKDELIAAAQPTLPDDERAEFPEHKPLLGWDEHTYEMPVDWDDGYVQGWNECVDAFRAALRQPDAK